MTEYISIAEAVERTGYSTTQINNWVRRGVVRSKVERRAVTQVRSGKTTTQSRHITVVLWSDVKRKAGVND